MIYNVFGGTLNLAQSIKPCQFLSRAAISMCIRECSQHIGLNPQDTKNTRTSHTQTLRNHGNTMKHVKHSFYTHNKNL